jgi:hypothetical protein
MGAGSDVSAVAGRYIFSVSRQDKHDQRLADIRSIGNTERFDQY